MTRQFQHPLEIRPEMLWHQGDIGIGRHRPGAALRLGYHLSARAAGAQGLQPLLRRGPSHVRSRRGQQGDCGDDEEHHRQGEDDLDRHDDQPSSPNISMKRCSRPKLAILSRNRGR